MILQDHLHVDQEPTHYNLHDERYYIGYPLNRGQKKGKQQWREIENQKENCE